MDADLVEEQEVTEAEVDHADQAVLEIRKDGLTTRRCLRCGDKLIVEDRGSGYAVYCETERCFRITFRGI